MPLVHNTVYTIRNDLTHTVIDLPNPTDDPEVVGTSKLSPLACSIILTRAIVSQGLGMARQK